MAADRRRMLLALSPLVFLAAIAAGLALWLVAHEPGPGDPAAEASGGPVRLAKP
jgi:hypothetical protein